MTKYIYSYTKTVKLQVAMQHPISEYTKLIAGQLREIKNKRAKTGDNDISTDQNTIQQQQL